MKTLKPVPYLIAAAAALMLSTAVSADRYDRSGDSYDDYRGRYDYDSDLGDREVERERESLERERERLKDQRESLEQDSAAKAAPQRCPSGFHPGNHSCSDQDRKRGCKDMKMSDGTTCNAGPFS